MSVEPPLTGSITRSVRRESASVRSPIDLAKSFIAAGLTSQYAKIHSGSRTSSRIAVHAVRLGEDEALLLEDALGQLAREVLGRADLVLLGEAVDGVRGDGTVGLRRALAARRGAAPARRRPALGDGLGRGLLTGPCRARLRLPGDRPDRGGESREGAPRGRLDGNGLHRRGLLGRRPGLRGRDSLARGRRLLGLRLPGRDALLRDRRGRRPGGCGPRRCGSAARRPRRLVARGRPGGPRLRAAVHLLVLLRGRRNGRGHLPTGGPRSRRRGFADARRGNPLRFRLLPAAGHRRPV